MFRCFKHVVLAGILSVSVLPAMAADSPVPMLRTVSEEMIQSLRAIKTHDQAKAYQEIQAIVLKKLVPRVDRVRMAKLVIGRRYWDGARQVQRDEFVKLFTGMVVATYTTALQSYSDQKVTFFPLRVDPNQESMVEVKSQIEAAHGSPVSVVYEMRHDPSGKWMIADLSVDGVGIVSSYRSQFADVLANQGFQALLDRMNAHVRAGDAS